MNFSKNRTFALIVVIVLGLLLTACGTQSNPNPDSNPETNPGENSNIDTNPDTSDPNPDTDDLNPDATEPSPEPEDTNLGADGDSDGGTTEPPASAEKSATETMVDTMLEKIEQPPLIDVSGDMVQDLYHFDPALLEQFTIKMPMMNVTTNEIAILQVKDAKDIPTIEEAIKQRAEDVQKQFETYLQDQYEHAKNYKLIVKDNYVLFVISEQADQLVNEFNSLFD